MSPETMQPLAEPTTLDFLAQFVVEGTMPEEVAEGIAKTGLDAREELINFLASFPDDELTVGQRNRLNYLQREVGQEKINPTAFQFYVASRSTRIGKTSPLDVALDGAYSAPYSVHLLDRLGVVSLFVVFSKIDVGTYRLNLPPLL